MTAVIWRRRTSILPSWGGNQPLCVIRNENAAGQGKVLLIRDSYSDSLAPFLSRSFEEVHLLDTRYYHMSPAQYAAENDIDEIVVLFSVPNFITEKSLVFLGAVIKKSVHPHWMHALFGFIPA